MIRLAAVLALCLAGCNTNKYSPESVQQASSPSKRSQDKKGSGSPNGTQAGVTVPDPNASKSPNVGRQAGVGNDPSDLEVADPKSSSGSDGRQNPKP